MTTPRTSRIHLAAFRYLNSLPLLSGFLEPDGTPGLDGFRFTFGTPAECAARLAEAEVEGALIPSVELARIPDIRMVPGIAVSTSREVRSVVLLARRPVRECRSIALDASSRTSVALLRILLARRFAASPRLEVMLPDAGAMLARHDAALLIADTALLPTPAGCTVIDLAVEWHAMTGLPFVFAVWALRQDVAEGLDDARRDAFGHSLRLGRERLGAIAEQEGARLGLTREEALAYLTTNIRYELGEAERAGLARFLALAAEEGLVPSAADAVGAAS